MNREMNGEECLGNSQEMAVDINGKENELCTALTKQGMKRRRVI